MTQILAEPVATTQSPEWLEIQQDLLVNLSYGQMNSVIIQVPIEHKQEFKCL